jgi:2-deoxy-D-gluconate 3-dehydrogenase
MNSSLFGLAGRTALVTGGSRGIGQAMALGLAEAGADIILVLRSKSQTETQSKIENLGRQCFILEADLGDAEAARKIVPAIVKEHRWFDTLVNVAGIQRRSRAEEFPQQAYDEIMQINLSATFRICRDTGKYWLDNNIKGSIINTASIASFQGGVNMAAYATSKGGVAQLTRAFSNEWACKGIRVNAIAPGSDCSPSQFP